MIIFVADRPIKVLSQKTAKNLAYFAHFDKTLDTHLEMLKVAHLSGHVLLLNVTPITAEKLFQFLNNSKLTDLQSVTIIPKNKSLVEKRIKKLYSVVKAAGGIVLKDDNILLMYRRGVWDLPKGKLDDDEKSKKAAQREVEEETGVKAQVQRKLCTTWHTYQQGGQRILKRTKWYVMRCTNDSYMKPQTSENIEKLVWATETEAKTLLTNSFSSIRFVVDSFLDKTLEIY